MALGLRVKTTTRPSRALQGEALKGRLREIGAEKQAKFKAEESYLKGGGLKPKY